MIHISHHSFKNGQAKTIVSWRSKNSNWIDLKIINVYFILGIGIGSKQSRQIFKSKQKWIRKIKKCKYYNEEKEWERGDQRSGVYIVGEERYL